MERTRQQVWVVLKSEHRIEEIVHVCSTEEKAKNKVCKIMKSFGEYDWKQINANANEWLWRDAVWLRIEVWEVL
jgi:hypothetical protein